MRHFTILFNPLDLLVSGEILIPLDWGVNGMFVGGRRQITVSPHLRYGGKDSGVKC